MFESRVVPVETIDYSQVEQLQHAKSLVDKDRKVPEWKFAWWGFKQALTRKFDRVSPVPYDVLRNIFFTPHNRSNLLRIPTMGYSYSDPRCKLLHASMTILVDFIEKEEPFRIVDWDATPEHRHAADEMLDIYRWWKTDPFAQNPDGPENFYSLQVRELLEYGRDLYGDEDNWIADVIEKSKTKGILHLEISSEAEKRADRQLARLANVRQAMWC